MATPPSFPTLAGLGWSVHKKPAFSTLVANHVSGREVRDALYQNPIWQFELTLDAVSSSPTSYPALGANSMQALMGFFLQMQGQFGTFLYTDPVDSAATNVTFATGDGVMQTFIFSRFMGVFLEPVGWVLTVSNIFLNGVNQPSGWDLAQPNSLVFTSPPGSGVLISATFTYAFQCRFDEDGMDFEEFMSNLWRVDSIKFKSVRTS
jgi:hypothetical protein